MFHNTRAQFIVLAVIAAVGVDTLCAQPPLRTELDTLRIPRDLKLDLKRAEQLQTTGKVREAERVYSDVIRKTANQKSPARFEAIMNLDQLRQRTTKQEASIQLRANLETYREMLKSGEASHRNWANLVLGQQYRNTDKKKSQQIVKDFGDVPIADLSHANQHLLAQAYKEKQPDKALILYNDLAKESRDWKAVDQTFELLGSRNEVSAKDADNALELARRMMKTEGQWLVVPGVSKVLANNSWDDSAKGKASELLSILLDSVQRATADGVGTADFTPDRLRREVLPKLEKNTKVQVQISELKKALDGDFDIKIDRQTAARKMARETAKWGGPRQYKAYLGFLNEVGEQFLVSTPDQPADPSKAAGAFYTAWINDGTNTSSALRLAEVIKRSADEFKDIETIDAAFREDLGKVNADRFNEKQGLELALAHLRLGDRSASRGDWKEGAVQHYLRAVALESTGFRPLPSAHERLAFVLAKMGETKRAAAEAREAGRYYVSDGDPGRAEVLRLMREAIGVDDGRQEYEHRVRRKLLGAMRRREQAGPVTANGLMFGPDGVLLVADWTGGSIFAFDMASDVEMGGEVPRELDVVLDEPLQAVLDDRPTDIYAAAFDEGRRLLYLSGSVKDRSFVARLRLGAEVTAEALPVAEAPHVRFRLPATDGGGQVEPVAMTYVAGHLVVLRTDASAGVGLNRLPTEIILFNLLTGDRQQPLRFEAVHPSGDILGRYPPLAVTSARIDGKAYLLTAYARGPITAVPLLDVCSPFPRIEGKTIAQIPTEAPGNWVLSSEVLLGDNGQAWISDHSAGKIWPLRLNLGEFKPIVEPTEGLQGPIGEPVGIDGRIRAVVGLGRNLTLVVTKDGGSIRARTVSLP